MYPRIMRNPMGNLSREVAFRRTAGMLRAVLRRLRPGVTFVQCGCFPPRPGILG